MFPFTIDFETTGRDAATARPIEVGVASPDDGAFELQAFIALPEGERIPVETSAVHHIIDEDLEGAQDWATVLDSLHGTLVLDGEPGDIVLIAHNAEYEMGVLADTWADSCSWICTYKCALVAWPDAPSHSNEGLRYWLQIGSNRGRKGATGAHSALHDAKVTAGIFNALRGFFYAELCSSGKIDGRLPIYDPEVENAIYRRMFEISEQPAELPTCPIGKERGKKWADIDAGFLSWCLRQGDMREDVKHACTKELARRAEARRA